MFTLTNYYSWSKSSKHYDRLTDNRVTHRGSSALHAETHIIVTDRSRTSFLNIIQCFPTDMNSICGTSEESTYAGVFMRELLNNIK